MASRDAASPRLLEDRDLAGAVRAERLALPGRPPVLQPEARNYPHELELGRPHVAIGRGMMNQAPPHVYPVVGPRDLPRQVVERLDTDMARVEPEDTRRVSGRHVLQLGNHHLDHEA